MKKILLLCTISLVLISCRKKQTTEDDYVWLTATEMNDNNSSPQKFEKYEIVVLLDEPYLVYGYDSRDDTYYLRPITGSDPKNNFFYVKGKYLKEYVQWVNE